MAGLEWNEDFFREVMRSAPIREAVEDVAEKAVSTAKSLAPVLTGNYRDSITYDIHKGAKRFYAYVFSDVPYSMPVESMHGTMTKTTGRL